MNTYNPYDPPRAPEPRRYQAVSETPPGDWLKWAYAAIVLLGTTIELVLLKAKRLGLDNADMLSLGLVLLGLGVIEMVVISGWVYCAWSSIPKEHRANVRSPLSAAGRMMIPGFNLYWAFVVQLRFCQSLDDALATTSARAPKGLALLAAALFFAPMFAYFSPQLRRVRFLLGLASQAVWFLYMHACDAARAVLHEERARAYERAGVYVGSQP